MDQLQEEIKKEAAKLEKLLKQAGYKMINFDIEKIHSDSKWHDIIIRATTNI